MDGTETTRREFMKIAGIGAAALSAPAAARPDDEDPVGIDDAFFVKPEELTLQYRHSPMERHLSYAKFDGTPEEWKEACRAKLAVLLGFWPPFQCPARRIRSIEHEGVTIEAWVMDIDASLSIPAYLLIPKDARDADTAVMAIHGHGAAEPCIGQRDDYHHMFALRLAQAGRIVLCPSLRGFGALGDMAFGDEERCLDYWRSSRGRQFTLISDAFLYGRTVIGHTVQDLLRWETWLAETRGVRRFDVAGISYGGDLAITYPAFSERIRRIYSSGSLGSFSVIFSHCYNAPAHGVPGVLMWMDRSDIAGLSAPKPIRLHYGELDTPGPRNNSASYNETVEPSLAELREIYDAWGAKEEVSLHVSEGRWHEMDIDDLSAFLVD